MTMRDLPSWIEATRETNGIGMLPHGAECTTRRAFDTGKSAGRREVVTWQ
jgi:hypothetical protein